MKCPFNSFQCLSEAICISNKTKCNGVYDCKDGTDEIGCERATCAFGSCSQLCVPKKGNNFNCKCIAGYGKGTPKNDTCVALDTKQKLLIASENGIQFLLPHRMHEGTYDFRVIGLNSIKIKSFDYYITTRVETVVFWIDYISKKIQKVTLKNDKKKDGSFLNTESKRFKRDDYSQDIVTIVEDLTDPVDLAVDYISEKLYVIDAKAEAIVVMNFDGGNRTTIVHTGRHPTHLVLDLGNRNIIWTTKMKAIMLSSMDGTEKKALITHDIEWASGLAIDYPTSRLYWVDQRKSTIETSLLNGSDIHYVWQLDELAKPTKLDVFEDFLYVTLHNQSIIKVNKFGFGNIETELQGSQRSHTIAVIHPLKQYLNVSNPCGANVTTCDSSTICLLSSANSSRRMCTCPDNMHKTVKDGVSIHQVLRS